MPFKATLLLADFAQVAEGKLYITGGGWTVIGLGAPSAVAVYISVPWDQTNRQHVWKLELVDSDGTPVTVPGPLGDQQEVALESGFKVGRPPGTTPGTDLGMPLAMNFGPLPLEPNKRYEWRFSLNGESDEDWRLPFNTAPLPEGFAPPGTGPPPVEDD